MDDSILDPDNNNNNDHNTNDEDTTSLPTRSNPLLNLTNQQSTPSISPLEQQVLDEYSRLLENMNKLSSTLSTLSSGPMTSEIADGLRLLERKVTSVYTLMKASVYSIVLQQGSMEGEGDSYDHAAGG